VPLTSVAPMVEFRSCWQDVGVVAGPNSILGLARQEGVFSVSELSDELMSGPQSRHNKKSLELPFG
jgi:hypothetical protein